MNRRAEIAGILILACTLLVLVSLLGFHPAEEPTISQYIRIQNPMGIVGVGIAYSLIKIALGYTAYLLPLVGFVWGWVFFTHRPWGPVVRHTLYFLASLGWLALSVGTVQVVFYPQSHRALLVSGLWPSLTATLIRDFAGLPGLLILVLAGWLILARGYFAANFYTPFLWLKERYQSWRQRRADQRAKQLAEEARREHTEKLRKRLETRFSEAENPQSSSGTADAPEELDPGEIVRLAQSGERKTDREHPPEPELFPPEPEMEETASADEIEVGEMVQEKEVDLDAVKGRNRPRRTYQLPTTDLLVTPPRIDDAQNKEELIERANFLAQSLATFGVEGKVVNVHPGPVITLFEVEPAEGVRVNKFVALADDLARVMEASRVRVIAPIPGKSSVGIEIPNRNPEIVYFKSVINSEKFAQATSLLTLAVGKTTSGEIAILDLAKMPHLLIAGTTGSGKSVCLNTIICSLLYQATPDEIKFMIIDPKKVEMSLYRALKGYHLLGLEDIDESIVTSTENAILALRALEKEMDRRYNVLSDAVVRNIGEYNERARKKKEPILPYIVLIIDELADLMMLSAKDVEQPIARLAQLSRAVGIHLVIATQRPSVDVITGVIKANFPARIAFQVATKIDSRTILDTPGAEKLIGRGDMLYQGPGSSEPVRLHNAFLSLDEIEAIMKYISQQPQAEELKLASIREVAVTGPGGETGGSEDELLKDAIRLVVTHQQGSISLLQRRLKVGYSRAARLIDEMEALGVVGPFTGSKAREVLVDESYLLSIE
ncbi:MAG: DNA translocase FtsK [Candidatus Neomarinimicrobiota bacterium]|nr:MAG: DNA translocase FtsK [Candidatus Neomarinimicrobiota bacterium]